MFIQSGCSQRFPTPLWAVAAESIRMFLCCRYMGQKIATFDRQMLVKHCLLWSFRMEVGETPSRKCIAGH